MKALISEPSRLFQSMLSSLVREAGYTPVIVSTAEDAFQYLQNDSTTVVIASYFQKDMNGIDFAKNLRAIDNQEDVPLFMITSAESPARREDMIAAGASSVIQKTNMAELLVELEDLGSSGMTAGKPDILYLQDDPEDAESISNLLEDRYYITPVSDIVRAQQEILSSNYDLVIMDLDLQLEHERLDFLSKLRSLERPKNSIPVLAVFTESNDLLLDDFLSYGGNELVIKPVKPALLQKRVEALVDKRKLANRVRLQKEHIRDLASTDNITGLKNWHYLADIGASTTSDARRHEKELSIIVFSLDNLEDIISLHGHKTGNEVLALIGEVILANSRKEDIPARVEGDVFVVLLPNCSQEEAVKKARKIHGELKRKEVQEITLAASFGVAGLSRAELWNFEELFQQADSAMDDARKQGGNKVSQIEQIDISDL